MNTNILSCLKSFFSFKYVWENFKFAPKPGSKVWLSQHVMMKQNDVADLFCFDRVRVETVRYCDFNCANTNKIKIQ